MGERTGSRVFQWVWSYVVVRGSEVEHIVRDHHAGGATCRFPSSTTLFTYIES
ncbi:hypothetical protein CLIM01_10888 [Colletotrichum limetticola]|uniref:Uncharacterized protein n=1 Tax=Colletotrichum limetticola TaxID=1209924 RepID=A0ABQ9PIA2_9PEZI|nr:hypothetical protein CLIM01_10888 [Colletotrichum limetticola]